MNYIITILNGIKLGFKIIFMFLIVIGLSYFLVELLIYIFKITDNFFIKSLRVFFVALFLGSMIMSIDDRKHL